MFARISIAAVLPFVTLAVSAFAVPQLFPPPSLVPGTPAAAAPTAAVSTAAAANAPAAAPPSPPSPPAPTASTVAQCPPQHALCCNTLQQSDAPAITQILGLLGVILGDVNGLVAVDCTSATPGGPGGVAATCGQQLACCSSSDSIADRIWTGCVPVTDV